VLGRASRQFEAALSGGGVTKGGNRWECAAEKENEEEREPASNSTSSSKREGGGRRTTHGRRAGLCSLAFHLFQCEAKQVPPRPSQQAPLTGAISGALAFVNPNPPTSRVVDMVDETEEGAEAETEWEQRHLRICKGKCVALIKV